MTEVKPYMCSCCNDIWSRENQKSIKLGKYELHLCPDCYYEYIISNNAVLDKIRAEIEECLEATNHIKAMPIQLYTPNEIEARKLTYEQCLGFIDKYKRDKE